MIRLLILSDAHRDYLSLAAAIRLHPEADAVFFLGDGEEDFYSQTVSKLLTNKKVTAVCGNCDMYSALPKEELVLLGGKRIFALHGHTRFVKHGLEALTDAAKEKHADLVLYGHTHTPRYDCIDGMDFLCPGSIRAGDYGLVDITDNGQIACWTAKL